MPQEEYLCGYAHRTWSATGSTRGSATRHESSAEEQVLIGLEHGDLGGALTRLSPELRADIRATVLDGLSTAEAVLLGIPAGTVKTRAMRARRQLRDEST
ncbi:RNA polymerase sigma factor [Micromonospora ureilytica]|uniref:RNA polymerase sigma factor n=1 Tax=Micromonospora ureilytica TaxID=709868 RepID=UPI002E1256DC|nr:hypothetical protein OHB55_09550 [Micromonospora ureilytica]